MIRKILRKDGEESQSRPECQKGQDLLLVLTSTSKRKTKGMEFTLTCTIGIPKSEHHKPEVVSAKQKELAKFLQYGVYEEVSDFGH